MRQIRLTTILTLCAIVFTCFAAASASAGKPPKPNILPRSIWDPNNLCKPKKQPDVGDVKLGFVHHSYPFRYANEDGTLLDARTQILKICVSHQNQTPTPFDDIGYHFIVDSEGNIYEGRAGGIENALVGAQTYGYNKVSFGAVFLGDFQVEKPTTAAIEAMARLFAWKLSLHNAPVEGTIDLTSAGDNKLRKLDRVSGHCHGFATECPGTHGVPILPQLRTRIAEIAKQYA